MVYNHLLLFFLWSGYCFLHSFLADGRIKISLQQKVTISERWYRLLYNVLALTTLIAILIYQISIKSYLFLNNSVILNCIAAVFMLTGITIMAICISKYFTQLSGIKEANPELVTTGLHHLVRHPLYFGTFIFITGIVLWGPYLSNIIAFTVIVGYTLWAIRLEEKKLIDVFGEEYIRYQQIVPMILPKITRSS